MTSKEALSYLLGEALYNIETSNKARECYVIIEKELEVLEDLKKYEELKNLMGTPIQDIMKRLEILEAIKSLLNDGVLWLEMEHEMVESEEHKEKKQLIKEWLDGK